MAKKNETATIAISPVLPMTVSFNSTLKNTFENGWGEVLERKERE